jgi:hypothetical protein
MILGVAAAGVGASVLTGSEPAFATDGNPVLIGKANTAKATTSVTTTKKNGLEGSTSDATYSGVEGIDTSSRGGFGLYGTSENGTGIYGSITGDISGHFAVQGADESTGDGGGAGVGGASTNGTGIYGTSTNATGVYGIHSTGVGTGVAGLDNSGNINSHGVYGSSGSGYGVYGTTNDGVGVYETTTGDNEGVGVWGNSVSPNSAGVYGTTTAEGSIGVHGSATGENGVAVYGASSDGADGTAVSGFAAGSDGTAVSGYADGTGDSYGVYAYSENSDSLYVDGKAAVTGTLSKGGGSFKIDHPVDPADKYLYHSFVESPDMKNVYDGTVTLDGDGRATVDLPDWFEALNRDYRYQLTALLGAAPELHVSALVADGKFSIAGGRADQQVSWQVTGIRQDAWANANRIPVEMDKKAEDQGRYLHPELFGGEPITALAKARGRRHRSSTAAVSSHDVKP